MRRSPLVAGVILVLFALSSCAQGNATEKNVGPLTIIRAEWSAHGGETRAVVNGTWVRGLSTPPSCVLLEGRNGKKSGWSAPEKTTSPRGNSFSKQFVAADEASRLDPLLDYHIRCSVNVSTGRTLDAVAPVSGETPRG